MELFRDIIAGFFSSFLCYGIDVKENKKKVGRDPERLTDG